MGIKRAFRRFANDERDLQNVGDVIQHLVINCACIYLREKDAPSLAAPSLLQLTGGIGEREACVLVSMAQTFLEHLRNIV